MLLAAEATVDPSTWRQVAWWPGVLRVGQNVICIIKFHSSLLFTLVADWNNLKEETFVLAHDLRGCSPTEWGRHGDSLAYSCGRWLHPIPWQLGSKRVVV